MKLNSININNIITGKKHNYTKKTIMEDYSSYDSFTEGQYLNKIIPIFLNQVNEIINEKDLRKQLYIYYSFGFDESYDKYTSFEYNHFSKITKDLINSRSIIVDIIDNSCLSYVENNFESITGQDRYSIGDDSLDISNYISEHYSTTTIIDRILPEDYIKKILNKCWNLIKDFYFKYTDKDNIEDVKKDSSNDGELFNEAQNTSQTITSDEEKEFFNKLVNEANKIDIYTWYNTMSSDDELLGKMFDTIIKLSIPNKFIHFRPDLYNEIKEYIVKAINYADKIIIPGAIKKLKINYMDNNIKYMKSNGEEYLFDDESDIIYFVNYKCSWEEIFHIYKEDTSFSTIAYTLQSIKGIIKTYCKYHKEKLKKEEDKNNLDGEQYNESLQLNETLTQLKEKNGFKVGQQVVNISSLNVEPETITKIEEEYTSHGIYLGTKYTLELKKPQTTYIWALPEKMFLEKYMPYEIYVKSDDDSNDGEFWDEE